MTAIGGFPLALGFSWAVRVAAIITQRVSLLDSHSSSSAFRSWRALTSESKGASVGSLMGRNSIVSNKNGAIHGFKSGRGATTAQHATEVHETTAAADRKSVEAVEESSLSGWLASKASAVVSDSVSSVSGVLAPGLNSVSSLFSGPTLNDIPLNRTPMVKLLSSKASYCKNSACCMGPLWAVAGGRGPTFMQAQCLDVDMCANTEASVNFFNQPGLRTRKYAFVLTHFGLAPEKKKFLLNLGSIQRTRRQMLRAGSGFDVDIVLMLHAGRDRDSNYDPLKQPSVRDLAETEGVRVVNKILCNSVHLLATSRMPSL